MAPVLLGLLRHAMTAAGPLIAVRAGLDPADVETLAGAALAFIGAGWSVADKLRRRGRA